MRVNAGGILFNVPVNHHPAAAITKVPFGEQVLIPGPELFGIRSTGRRGFTPNLWQPYGKRLIYNLGNGLAQVLDGKKSPSNIKQVLIGILRL